jgi:hypothetical protein
MFTIAPFRPQPPRIRRLRLRGRQAAIGFNDFALMLEIDLALGRRDKFRRRLQRALNDAQRQGVQWLMEQSDSDATIYRLVGRARK